MIKESKGTSHEHWELGVMGRQSLTDCCTLTSDIASRQRLRSASRHQLNVPQHNCCSRFGRRAFSVAGPRVWNLLPDHLRDPSLSSGFFRSALKTFLFTTQRNTYAVEAFFLRNALYKLTIIIIIIIIIMSNSYTTASLCNMDLLQQVKAVC